MRRKTLRLRIETLRQLDTSSLHRAAGGQIQTYTTCHTLVLGVLPAATPVAGPQPPKNDTSLDCLSSFCQTQFICPLSGGKL